MTRDEAVALTGQIREASTELWRLVKRAKDERADVALDYPLS